MAVQPPLPGIDDWRILQGSAWEVHWPIAALYRLCNRLMRSARLLQSFLALLVVRSHRRRSDLRWLSDGGIFADKRASRGASPARISEVCS
jgi:hypothetical protein